VPLNVYISDGRIVALKKTIEACDSTYDAEGNLVIPGIIDPHVHFSLDLGRYVSRDDFHTGSKAAAFGGVTTFLDFLDPSDSPRSLRETYDKRKKEASDACLDHKFHATLKSTDCDLKDYVMTMRDLKLDSLKVFTTYSESGRMSDRETIETLLGLQNHYPFLLLAHIENDAMITLDETYTHQDLPRSRPSESETSEALALAELVNRTHGELYMVHLSSGHTIERLKERFSGILNRRFHVESCPQYFTFSTKMLKNDQGRYFTFAPPLRSEKERTTLIGNIDSIGTIGTDHCAFNKADKHNERLIDMPLGIPGVEQAFDIMYARFGPSIIDKMTRNVAQKMRLPKKGRIKEGYDADLFIYEETDRTIDTFHNATDYNPYLNQPVKGHVKCTMSRGRFIMKDRTFLGGKGRLLNEEKSDH